LWRIEETEAALAPQALLTGEEADDLATITHPAQRIEWLACRVLARQLLEAEGLAYAGLYKDEHGKPHPLRSAAHVSLSHTGGWAAVALSQEKPVGLDIEPIRPQFIRVVPRVLSAAEIDHAGGEVDRLAVYWCAKEALYKLYGRRQLTFREHLLIEPFADRADWITGHVRLPEEEQTLRIYCARTGPGLVAVAF